MYQRWRQRRCQRRKWIGIGMRLRDWNRYDYLTLRQHDRTSPIKLLPPHPLEHFYTDLRQRRYRRRSAVPAGK